MTFKYNCITKILGQRFSRTIHGLKTKVINSRTFHSGERLFTNSQTFLEFQIPWEPCTYIKYIGVLSLSQFF